MLTQSIALSAARIGVAALLLLSLSQLAFYTEARADVIQIGSKLDLPDTNASDGKASPPTLRAAIMHANITPGPDAIEPVGMSGDTIYLTEGLPACFSTITMDMDGMTISGLGMTQQQYILVLRGDGSIIRNVRLQDNPGGGGLYIQANRVEVYSCEFRRLDGAGVNLGGDANGNIIGKTSNKYFSNAFYGLTGFGGSGIVVMDEADSNIIQYNCIGSPNGENRVPNSRYGVVLEGSHNIVKHNIISGNDYGGVDIQAFDTDPTGNVIDSNWIGTTVFGGSALFNGQNGIGIQRCGSTIIRSNIISGNTGNGIYSGTPNAKNVTIELNMIGLNGAGTISMGNGFGITLNGPGSRILYNVVSGNLYGGVSLAAGDAVIQNNSIGVDADGKKAFPNGGRGIQVSKGSNILIGGWNFSAPNTISGNTQTGIVLAGKEISEVQIYGNLIGTNYSGDSAIPNGGGIALYQAPEGVMIASNVISGNMTFGIEFESAFGGFPAYDSVASNYIGVDITGKRAIPNGTHGIHVKDAHDLLIGGEHMGNVISGNLGDGIVVQGDSAYYNWFEANKIGVGVDGTTPIPNIRGMHFAGGIYSVVGGPDPASRNIIAHNLAEGVALTGNAYGISLICNSIFKNDSLGIDIGDDGPDANDAQDADFGPNGRLNAPVITGTELSGSDVIVNGTYSGIPFDTVRIDLYANSEVDPSGYGEGEFYRNYEFVALNANGSGSFAIPVPSSFSNFSALAVDSWWNTSEFSRVTTIGGAVDLEITMSPDPGTPQHGKLLKYLMQVKNLGNATASNVRVLDTLPSSLLYKTSTSSKGVVNVADSILTVTIGTMAAEELVNITLETEPQSLGLISNIAHVITASTDANPANNDDTVEVNVQVAGVGDRVTEVSLGKVLYSHLEDPVIELTLPGIAGIELYDARGVMIVGTTSVEGRLALQPFQLSPGAYMAKIEIDGMIEYLPVAILE